MMLLVTFIQVLLLLKRVSCQSDENRPYKFGFNIEGHQHRQEEKDNRGIIKGEYGFITADGYYRITMYATDENGNFRIISMRSIYVGFPPEDPSTTPGPSSTVQRHLPLHAKSVSISQAESETTSTAPSRSKSTSTAPSRSKSTSTAPSFSQSTATAPSRSKPTPAYSNGGREGCSSCFIPTNSGASSPEIQTTTYRSAQISAVTSRLQSKFKLDGGNKTSTENKNKNNNFLSLRNNQSSNFSGEEIVKNNKDNRNGPEFSNMPETIEHPQTNFQNVNLKHGITETPTIISTNGDDQLKRGKNYQSNLVNSSISSKIRKDENFDTKSNILKSSADSKTDKNNEKSDRPRSKPKVGEVREGLPEGVTMDDIKKLLYVFNYTVGFHGHHEDGYRSGNKVGDYYFDGRDGIERRVEYLANEFGYQPNITLIKLDDRGDDVKIPKEESEKEFGLKGYEFKWFYRR